MEKQSFPALKTRGNALGGILLIGLGLVFLLGQIFDIHVGRYVWPFMIIIPGVLLFVASLAAAEEPARTLAIIGGIVTMVGVILWVQSITDWWASWAYAWALVAPTGPGVGLWLLGTAKRSDELVKSGKDLVRVGLVLFVSTAVFFELIIGISGFGLGHYGWPLLLILLGLFLLVRNIGQSWRNA